MAKINGTNGDDTLIGTKKDDIILGKGGHDYLEGGKGNDKINGGDDYDHVTYFDDREGVVVDLAAGTATDGWGDKDKLKHIEAVVGSRFNDVLRGSNEDNTLKGEDGNDKMTGRGGADQFVFNVEPDSASNHDIIKDFDAAEGDSIKFGGDYVGLLTSAVQGSETPLDPNEFVANAAGTPTTGDQHVVYNTTTGDLFYDPDGNATSGDQELIATLKGAPVLTAANFEIWG